MSSHSSNAQAGDSNEYGADTAVSSSSMDNSKLMMDTNSSTTCLQQNSGEPSTPVITEADYPQPSSSSNLANSPPKSDGPTLETDSNSNASVTANRKSIAHYCEFIDPTKGQCKQRAINTFKYCIRHILLDPNAPYKQCQHQRKPKNKQEKPLLCTNAIRASCPEIYCSTHLIMNGLKDPKVSTKKENKLAPKGTNKEKKVQSEQQEGLGSEPYPHATAMCTPSISQSLANDHLGAKQISQYPPGSEMFRHQPDYGTLPYAVGASEETSGRIDFRPSQLPAHIISTNNQNQQMQFFQSTTLCTPDKMNPRLGNDRVNFHLYERRQHLLYSNQEAQFCINSEEKLTLKGNQNEDLSTCNLSKTHPQLAAKLLQTGPLNRPTEIVHEKKLGSEFPSHCQNTNIPLAPVTSMHEHIPNSTTVQHFPAQRSGSSVQQATTSEGPKIPSTPAAPSKNQFIENSPNAKYIMKGPLMRTDTLVDSSAHRIPRVNYKEFVQPSLNPHIASSLTFLNFNPPPRRYDLDRLVRKFDINASSEHTDALLEFQRERELCENAQLLSPNRKRPQKVIKLRQKRQKVRIDGKFRSIPMVDSMCRIVESQDFDRKDLFPLGLEPSDDESSDDSFPSLYEEKFDYSSIISPCNRPSSSRLELYLLKKQLRLESSRLVQRAKLCVPINTAAREYKNSVGAALRVRKNNMKKERMVDEQQHRLSRCYFTSQQQTMAGPNLDGFIAQRCPNLSLPWANHCAEHITSTVAQQLFIHCKWHLCNEAVSPMDLILFDGFCKHHHSMQRQHKETHQPTTLSAQSKHPHYEQQHHYRSYEATSSRCIPYEGPSTGHFGPSTSTIHRTEDHLNETEPMDVSLASVAKDLGFEGRELTDILAKLPVEEGYEGDMDPDEDNLLTDINKDDSDETPAGISLGHSWADVEQFLLEQEEGLHPNHVHASLINMPKH